jgi:hypothetical protein
MKTKYLKTLLALAVLAAVWGGSIYWNRRLKKASAKSTLAHRQKLFPLKSKDVESFTLRPRQGAAISCARQQGKWEIVQPRQLPADATNVGGFLNSLTGATVHEVVASHPASLKDYGLDPPAETIEITTDATPHTFTLLLGDSTPTNSGLYAQVAGKPQVVTLASYMKASLEKSLFDLRDKRAVTLDIDQLQKIQVSSKGTSYTLVKNPEGAWDLMLPPAVRADHFSTADMVDDLRGLQMQSILEETKKDLPKYGLNAPRMTLRLSGAGQTQTLLIGKKDNGNYDAMNTALDPIFTLGSDFFADFDKSPDQLRDKSLFSFSTFDAKKVEITTPKGHWVFQQQNNQWKETTPSGKNEASDKIENLIDQLSGLQATSFPTSDPTNLAAYGLTHPEYRFQVTYGAKNRTQTVEASKVGGHSYARRSTDSVPSEISSSDLSKIEKDLASL